MPVMNHIHKLKKHKYKTGAAVYFCVLDCNFKVEAPLALGKESLCYICNEPFIMTEASLRLVKPHCSNCGRREVKDADGKKHYVRKVGTRILSKVAADSAKDLRERLAKVVTLDNDDSSDIL